MTMTPAPISVERLEIDVVGDVCGPRFEMAPHPAGDYVLYSDYAALLQQLAEREAECERLRRLNARLTEMCNEHNLSAAKAERAREEARTLLTKINRFGVLGLALEEEINAFLAASGGKDNG